MSKLVIRHGLSQANNRKNYGTPAFGNKNARLMPLGIKQATELGLQLRTVYGVGTSNESVAVSELRRTQDTALYAGFQDLVVYPSLNEEKGGLGDEEVRQALLERNPPEATIKAARFLIEHPPEEKYIVAHAFLIGAVCLELGVYQERRFHPEFCEIRELPI